MKQNAAARKPRPAEPRAAWSPHINIWNREQGKPVSFTIDLPDVSRESLKAQLHGDRLTVTGLRTILNPDKGPLGIINEFGRPQPSLAPLQESETFTCVFQLPSTAAAPSRIKARYDATDQTLTIDAQERFGEIDEIIDEIAASRGLPKFHDGTEPFPIEVLPVLPHTAEPQTETRTARQMIEDEYALQLGRSLAQKTIIKGGTRYFPLSFAAPLTQAPETTIRDWIRKDTKFDGKPIKVYTSPANGLYVSEDSVRRMALRFIKWQKGRSAGPSGPVSIGETDDQSGYISLPDAARTIGVGHNTLWRWATTPTATPPSGTSLDVIKCPASDQFYIRERDVSELRKHIPRSGLSRGPRPQLAPQP
jgi:hypothetical protein